MTRLIRWAIKILILYALCVCALLFARKALIYPFDTNSATIRSLPGVEARELDRADGSKLVAWVAKPDPGQPVLFYLMGNIGNLDYFSQRFRKFREAGFGLVAMAYQGGGGADGYPSEAALKADAHYLWDNIDAILDMPDTQKVIYGQSLGTGIAVDLARMTEPLGIVLETPFTRLCAVIQAQLKFVPACLLMWDEHYPIIDQISAIDAPILLLHGTSDRTIPYDMSLKVRDAAPDAELRTYQDAGHNNLARFGALADAINFIKALK